VKRILYASDLGLYGPYVLKQVMLLAESSGARVDILHVIEPMGVFAESIINTFMSEADRQYLRAQGVAELLERIRMQVIDVFESDYGVGEGQGCIGSIVVEQGDPSKVILEQAQARNVEVIAIGSHGQHAYRGGLIGSVVAKVLQTSPVPVYMVPMVNLESLGRKARQ
jgi:nucleotide-binding universal stress UspA family protein